MDPNRLIIEDFGEDDIYDEATRQEIHDLFGSTRRERLIHSRLESQQSRDIIDSQEILQTRSGVAPPTTSSRISTINTQGENDGPSTFEDSEFDCGFEYTQIYEHDDDQPEYYNYPLAARTNLEEEQQQYAAHVSFQLHKRSNENNDGIDIPSTRITKK